MAGVPGRRADVATFAVEGGVRFPLDATRAVRVPGRTWGRMVARGRASVPDDFAVFCREQHGRVIATIAVYCGDAALAEEVAQEALAKACQHWGRVSVMDAPGAWLHRVALNLVRSRFRRRQLERRTLASQATPATHVDVDVAELVDLRTAVTKLSERRRTAVLLRHVAGLSVTETATAMELSENAVRSLTSRGLSELRAELDRVEVPHA